MSNTENSTETLTAEINGRTYTLVPQPGLHALKADLEKRGFFPAVYTGHSPAPTRRHSSRTSLVFQQKDGRFVVGYSA